MVFNDFYFIFLFFPVFYVLYLLLRRSYAKWLIVIGSVVFYTIGVWGHPFQLGLLLAVTAVGTVGCMLFQQPRFCRKWLLAVFIVIVAAPLGYVKLAGLVLPTSPALPLGLSFYTFQMIAFLVYAWREGQVDPLSVAAGVLFFPKLLSGPIAEPRPLLRDMWKPKLDKKLIDASLQEFIIGLAYKVILADHLGGVLGKIRMRTVQGVSVQLAWLGVICYGLQLYFDFCGYSRMAMGISGMLGIRLPENFRHPYCSTSIREFWRRWHITLGTWFRKHVYIPLGGSRNGAARMVLATLVVWLLTGIWHGAGWNFVFWGLTMFVLLMGEYFIWGKWLEKVPVIGHIYVPFIIMLSWIFFITTGPAEAGHYFIRLFGVTNMPFDAGDWKIVLSQCWMYLVPAVIFATPLPQMLFKKVSKKTVGWVILAAVFVASIFFMSTAASEPFLYFSF
ncbi:MAG: MBOAT family protein [Lachnospiraceae bacterium]|nr:MBOAT family protein [Lachnospiraceae bacterium]